MPYLSLKQVLISTRRLRSLHVFFGFAFLAFKKHRLPVGESVEFGYAVVENEILRRYFSPIDVGKFFNPFSSSNKNSYWVSDRYASTSLQRVITDTFGEAILHDKGTSLFGWKENYVSILSRLMRAKSAPIPAIDLAVWLYRDLAIPSDGLPGRYLLAKLTEEFRFSSEEFLELFEPNDIRRELELDDQPFDSASFFNVFGWPEDAKPSSGATLDALALSGVGPATALSYRPSSRLNVIVGDNSVGKTFLLDAAWWALTKAWSGYPAEPRTTEFRRSAEIAFVLRNPSGYEQRSLALFDPLQQSWQRSDQPIDGFGFYARHDGSISVWDSLRPISPKWKALPSVLVFDKDSIWNGLGVGDGSGRKRFVCNGMIADLVNWGRDGESASQRSLFDSMLRVISRGTEIGGLGAPVEIPGDSRLVPTVRMPYGQVPLFYSSAGTQRALSIAYLLVWAWTDHLSTAKLLGRQPYQSIVLLFDELEAHLHPKWQRQILPALQQLVEDLGEDVKPQFHVATHSPLVLASAEPGADQKRDAIHLLHLDKRSVTLTRHDYARLGTVDAWLTSEFFALPIARSKPAEDAIERAKAAQLRSDVTLSQVDELHRALLRTLPDDDPFWIRWNYFRERRRDQRQN